MKICIFGISVILFLAVGLPCGAFFIGPLNSSSETSWLAVTNLSTLNPDGSPARYSVSAPRRDAWTRLPDGIAGDVYLRRAPETGMVIALHTATSRMRLPVIYDHERHVFVDRCWGLIFDTDGKQLLSQGDIGTENLKLMEVKVQDQQISIRGLE